MRPYYYLGNGRALTMLADGKPFFVDTRDVGITTWIVLGGHWETFADEILCGVTRLGDRVLDAGANQGYYTVRLGHRVGPEGHVTAFEPNPHLLPILRDNVAVNGLSERTSIHARALGDAPGSTELTFSHQSIGSGTLLYCPPEGVPDDSGQPLRRETVEIVVGDDFLAPDTAFDVMKFDIEGYEAMAAAGLGAILARSSGAPIMVEVAPRGWARFGDLGEILQRFTCGTRKCFRMAHDGLLDPFDVEDPAVLAQVSGIADPFYLLMMPPLHWAMDFVRSRSRAVEL